MDAALRSLLDWYAEMGVDVPKVPDARPVRTKRPAASNKSAARKSKRLMSFEPLWRILMLAL